MLPAAVRLLLGVLLLTLAAPAWPAAERLWHRDLATAQAEARRLDKPVFVYFDAAWCSWCHRYERQTLQTPEVRRALRRHAVPVRIDWDARADLVHRFGGRGLPFNVLLAPDGQVVRTFTGILAPDDLIALLRRPAAGEDEPAAPIQRPQSLDAAAYRAFRDAFLAHLDRLYDPALGTLAGRFATGTGLKRPQPRTWLWLADNGLWPERRRRAARADAGRLLDRLDGGFFYYVDPHRPDSHLETAKLLEPNAWLAAWLADTPGQPRLAAQSGWFFLNGVLRAPAGGFWRAQVADADYYAQPVAQRLRRAPPPVQRLKLAGANAEAALALVRVGRRLDRPQAAAAARGALDFVLARMWRAGRLHRTWRPSGPAGPELPGDLLRVLVAGAAVQAAAPDPQRATRLGRVADKAAAWLAGRMAVSPPPSLRPELAGWAARACGLRARYPQLPDGCQGWALRRLALAAETRPDWLVPGLRAWRQRLDRQTAGTPLR
jgi:hypothetical protein